MTTLTARPFSALLQALHDNPRAGKRAAHTGVSVIDEGSGPDFNGRTR